MVTDLTSHVGGDLEPHEEIGLHYRPLVPAVKDQRTVTAPPKVQIAPAAVEPDGPADPDGYRVQSARFKPNVQAA